MTEQTTTTPAYMVTAVWRGRMHVDPIRVFTGENAEAEAKAYAWTLVDQPTIYLVTDHSPPKKVRGNFWNRAKIVEAWEEGRNQ